MYTRETLTLEYNARINEANRIRRAALSFLLEECEKLGHSWVLHQIAGEGRYCKYCGAHDPNFID